MGVAQESRIFGSLSQSKESTLQSGPMRNKSQAFLEWLRINPRKVDHEK
jgi:hypothetical protein